MRMVGIIAAHWEQAELMMERAIAETMEHEFARVAILTANIGFRSKCDLLMAHARVFQQADKATWSEFTQIIRDLQAVYALRNTYVHAKWKTNVPKGDPPQLVTARTSGGRFTIKSDPVDITEMNDAATKIWETGERFTRFGILLP
jgi:hypothetical protein